MPILFEVCCKVDYTNNLNPLSILALNQSCCRLRPQTSTIQAALACEHGRSSNGLTRVHFSALLSGIRLLVNNPQCGNQTECLLTPGSGLQFTASLHTYSNQPTTSCQKSLGSSHSLVTTKPAPHSPIWLSVPETSPPCGTGRAASSSLGL